MKHFASYDSLMRHMRKTGINIHGSNQKRHLQLVGYFHGYKGYRYNKIPSNRIPFTDFNEIRTLIEFDEALKAAMYLPLMQLEIAIKSLCTDKIVTTIKSNSFSVVYQKAMSNDSPQKKLKCRDSIYSAMTRRYNSPSKIVPHYYNQDNYVPLWGIIEELTLGELSQLIETLNPSIKLSISKKLGIPKNYNTDGKLLPKIILVVKDFRNAIAHNKVVFDARYVDFKKRQSIGHMLISCTSINEINFNSVIDDIILVFFIMKNLKFSKSQLQRTLKTLLTETEKLFSKLDYQIYREILPVDSHAKLTKLKQYLRKK